MNPNNPGYYREDGWACGVGRVCVQPDLSMLSPASILPDRYGGGATYTYLPTYLPMSVYVCVCSVTVTLTMYCTWGLFRRGTHSKTLHTEQQGLQLTVIYNIDKLDNFFLDWFLVWPKNYMKNAHCNFPKHQNIQWTVMYCVTKLFVDKATICWLVDWKNK